MKIGAIIIARKTTDARAVRVVAIPFQRREPQRLQPAAKPPVAWASAKSCAFDLDSGKSAGWTKEVASLLELVADSLKD
jgi:hypothetical protein